MKYVLPYYSQIYVTLSRIISSIYTPQRGKKRLGYCNMDPQ